MGHSRISLETLATNPQSRVWETVERKGDVHFLRHSKHSEGNEASPMHTHTKTKIYVMRYEKGKLKGQVKEISVMDPRTGKKLMDIHTKDEGIGPHVHHWKNFKRTTEYGEPLTKAQMKFVENIVELAKTAKQ